MEHITTYAYKDESYSIVKQDGKYWAVNENDIDCNGKLTRDYNGATALIDSNFNSLLQSIRMQYEVKQLRKQGIPEEEVMIKLYEMIKDCM